MKKGLFLGMLLAASMTVQAEQVIVQTKNTMMVLNLDNGKQPQYAYYGVKLSDYDLTHLQAATFSSSLSRQVSMMTLSVLSPQASLILRISSQTYS